MVLKGPVIFLLKQTTILKQNETSPKILFLAMLRFAIKVLGRSIALCSNTTVAAENVVATTKHANTALSCMQTQLEIH